jgi:hypothetical protein
MKNGYGGIVWKTWHFGLCSQRRSLSSQSPFHSCWCSTYRHSVTDFLQDATPMYVSYLPPLPCLLLKLRSLIQISSVCLHVIWGKRMGKMYVLLLVKQGCAFEILSFCGAECIKSWWLATQWSEAGCILTRQLKPGCCSYHLFSSDKRVNIVQCPSLWRRWTEAFLV